MRAVLAILLGVGTVSYGQSVISAHSGVVHYTEGDVTIDKQAIHPKFAEYPEVKPDQVIATEEGRAELLLTPGVFLRLAENSSVRMISNSLADTRLEFLSGSALIEVAELLPKNAITFEAAGTPVALAKKGLYRFDAGSTELEAPRMRVYDGEARVGAESTALTVRKGHEVALGGSALVAASFDTKDTDAFYRWGARRSEYVAEANVVSARVANDPRSSGYTGGVNSPVGAWSWNPYFGMFTYMPGGDGLYLNPFGYTFYSPAAVLYAPVIAAPVGFRSIGPGVAASSASAPARVPVSRMPPSGMGTLRGSAPRMGGHR